MKQSCPGSDRARLTSLGSPEGLSSLKKSRRLLGTETEKVISGHQALCESGK